MKSNKLGRLLRLAPDFDLCHIGFKKYTRKNLNSRFVKYRWLLGALGRITVDRFVTVKWIYWIHQT